jgi:hypothetical protein
VFVIAPPIDAERRSRQQPPVERAELPLTPGPWLVADGPDATAMPEPPVCPAEPLLTVPPTVPDDPAPTEAEPPVMPELVVPLDKVPVVPGCSMQFGLTTPAAPVFAPPCARTIELEPRISAAATLNNLIDLFM